MTDLSKLYEAVLSGNAPAAAAAAREALEAGADPLELVTGGITPAMGEVGARFEKGDAFVPELLISARATKGVFEIIRPLLARKGAKPVGRIVMGTVKGDLHDIGKNLVSAMLEGGGFEVVDLGVNVPPEKFIEAARDRDAQVVGLSALLTTTMTAMKTTIEAIRTAGLREKVRVMVGGAPVTRAFAEQVGADAYGESAAAAVAAARRLVGA
jgi:corrinoid protein of di/trimethylamine methyltransferase